jgi:endoglucanase
LGEWGARDKGNLAERVKHAAYFEKTAKKYNIPTIWWDNGNFNDPKVANSGEVFGLLNRNNNTFTFQTIVDAIMTNAK